MLDTGSPYEYSFEIETLLQQFVALLDGSIVRRYDKNEETQERIFKQAITPRYIFGTKQRVLYYLVNKAKNYTMPAVCVSLSGIKGNKEKFAAIYNKIEHTYDNSHEEYYRPLPIVLSLKVSIITKYMTDLYQLFGAIASKFSQGHKHISWFVPFKQNNDIVHQELRSKVSWNMDFGISERDKVDENTEDKFIGDMTFEIEGHLFPEAMFVNNFNGIIKNIGSSIVVNDELLERTNNITEIGLDVPLISSIIENERLYEQIDGMDIEDDIKEYLKEKLSDMPYKNPQQYATNKPWVCKFFLQEVLNGVNNSLLITKDKHRLERLSHSNNAKIYIDGYNFDDVKVLLLPKSSDKGDTCLTFPLKENGEGELMAPPYLTEDAIFDYNIRKDISLRGWNLKYTINSKNNITVELNQLDSIDGFDPSDSYDIVVYNDYDYSLIGRSIDIAYPYQRTPKTYGSK